MIAIIDYDAGNIRSVEKALQYLGQEVVVTDDADALRAADKVVLPGVGAFGDCMEKLDRRGLSDVIRGIAADGKPFLGICLGLQLLFERSEESPGVAGLGILRGEVLRIPEGEGRKIPHMGWKSLHIRGDSRLFAGISQSPYVYFVHSYYAADCVDAVTATADYGAPLTASVADGNVFGCQFHPEKSGDVGLSILRAFCEVK